MSYIMSLQRLQETESDSCAQQREQESLLAAICQTLKEEHQAKHQRLQKDTAQVHETQKANMGRKGWCFGVEAKLTPCGLWSQEKQKLVLQLELAQKETERLRMMLEEKESSCNQITAQTEEQHQHWAQDLQAECRNLYLLLDQSGEKYRSVQLPLR